MNEHDVFTDLTTISDNLALLSTVQSDFIEPTDQVWASAAPAINDSPAGPITLLVRDKTYQIKPVAHEQIKGLTGMGAYYDKLLTEDRELLATNINTRFDKLERPVMLRTQEDWVRAMPSNSYRRLDHPLILDPIAERLDGTVGWNMEASALTDTRMHLRFVNKLLEKKVAKVGDMLNFGFEFTNSEVALGYLAFKIFITNLRCGNGQTVASNLVKCKLVHRGQAVMNDEALQLSEKTLLLEQAAAKSLIEDTVKAAFDLGYEQIAPMAAMFDAAAEREVPRSVSIPKVIGIVAKQFGVGSYSEQMLDRFTRNGMLSQYGVADSLTEIARDTRDFDEKARLQDIGFNIISMGSGAWQNALTAAA